jgi:isoleucyl-tRNA synthetase
LISNVALAVSPDEIYVNISYKGVNMILAEKRARVLMKEGEYVINRKMMGSDLEGIRYEPLYSFVKPDKPAHFVAVADFVTMEDGTGVVHIAPAFGEDDYNLGQTYGLPMVQPVEANGSFSDPVTPWKGMFVKSADPLIIEDLKNRGLLEGIHPYKHQYPFCWRCDTPLLYYARKGYYIRMSQLKENLLRNNARITWYPDNIKDGRFGNFLEEVKDWNLSRERYWGTPLPMWKCEKGHEHMVGSIEELKALSGMDHIPELHRPYVDAVKFPCPQCKGEMTRVSYVIDCWYDSGSAPHASMHYPFENVKEFKRQFPRDFIAEGIDQTRGWFYSLLAVSTAVFDQPSYLSCICHAHVMDAEGKKMSKSKGNVVDPWKIFESDGADAIRWYLLSNSAPWKPKLFAVEGVKEVNRSFLSTVRNVAGFYRTYSQLDGYVPKDRTDPRSRSEVDRWLLSKLNGLFKEANALMDDDNLFQTTALLQSFVVDDLSNWYVRVNRRRFWGEEDSTQKRTAYDTLAEAIDGTARVLAPFAPFHAEKTYMTLGMPSAPDSVHMLPFPLPDISMIDPALETSMAALRRVVELGRAARNNKNLKVRQPLFKCVIKGAGPFSVELSSLIKSELNVKEIDYESDLSKFFEMTADPDPKALGVQFKAASAGIKAKLLEMDPKDLAKAAKAGTVSVEIGGTKYELGSNFFRFHEVLPERWIQGVDGDIEVLLDTTVNEKLILEGISREVVRRIQTMRKDLNLPYDAKIDLTVSGDPDIIKGIEAYRDYIMNETLCSNLVIGDDPKAKDWDLDQGKLRIAIRI